jgi:hypothetical protein
VARAFAVFLARRSTLDDDVPGAEDTDAAGRIVAALA